MAGTNESEVSGTAVQSRVVFSIPDTDDDEVWQPHCFVKTGKSKEVRLKKAQSLFTAT